ncbi:hypothetical protein BDV38DRAFT_255051 [Aspergillus pseudotamarii]|uniref:Signal peptide-containing protein n=1 Tax=Aspergillus pseudotamarii TaxID=132259 RepID=A0A5N6SKT7_ASPPS|nr:uncharacterized protein BDV38DRAFT_255051 [Aspergillus pseudotamarii]KAE8134507.1 hypothetical protein BDV38DRAFT_255051 [Aspergillus pseudotamarii]
MWLWRGAQSAVFYYATCTPCAEKVDRRKRMKEAEAARSRREKEKNEEIIADQPRPFPQPTAFSTNPGWAEEIALGPGPPARRGGNRSAHRRTDSWNTDGLSANSGQDVRASQKKDKSSLMQPIEERWNRMRYQREDEPLWGEEVEVKGSSVGLSGSGKSNGPEPSKYYIARVPPVNDLHPPIVSGPKSRAETRWMLQPVPSARVMAGKDRFPTQKSSTSDPSLTREKSPNKTSDRTPLPPLSTQHVEKKPARVRPPFAHLDDDDDDDDDDDPRPLKTPEPKDSREYRSPSSLTYGRDESNFVIASSLRSRSDSSSLASIDSDDIESPRVSIQSPQTPISRPMSKEADDGSKLFRPHVSKTLSNLHREDKKVQLLHLEISDPQEEVGLGDLEQIRPWRWSMDI